MATVQRSAPPGWREATRYIGRLLLSPPGLIYFGLAFTTRWWIPAATYVFLKSFQWAPSGFCAWLSIGILGTILVGGFSASLVVLVRQARPLRLAKRSLASGEIGAAERLQRAREEVYRQGTGKWLLASAIAVQPLIPACLALIIYNGMQLPDGRLVNGKLVVHGRAQQLREWLQWQENRGIFTPIQGFK